MISHSDKRCEHCHKYLLIENDKEFCFYCNEIAKEDKRHAEEAVSNVKRIETERLKDVFVGQSLINNKLLKANFDNYSPNNESQEKAKRICERYANKFSFGNPQNLMLIGSYGVGKSHLAVSITKVVMDKKIPCLFISVPKLLTKIKSSYHKDSDITENQILKAIENIPLLVLDDIGAESDEDKENISSWAKSKLFEIVDSRVGKHTIYTTNLDNRKLIATYGERNASRMKEDTTDIYMDGNNYRMRDF